METLPDICPGFNQKEVLNTSSFTYQAFLGDKNNTSVVFSNKSLVSHQISSFWMDQGSYDCELTMYNGTDTNNTMTIAFKSNIELTWFMLFIVTSLYLVYAIIGVHAVMTKDYH